MPTKRAGASACGVLLDVASLSEKGGSRTNSAWVDRLTRNRKRRRGQEPVGKAAGAPTSRGTAPRDPHGMVKATLLEAQSRSDHARPAATLVSAASPCAPDTAYAGRNDLQQVLQGSRGEAPGSEPGSRGEWAT